MMNKKNKNEIKWNIINSCLAGALVLLGSFADGNITIQGVGAAIVAGLLVAFTKFRDYWTSTKKGSKVLFNFI